MAKRKSSSQADGEQDAPLLRRSTRQKTAAVSSASASTATQTSSKPASAKPTKPAQKDKYKDQAKKNSKITPVPSKKADDNEAEAEAGSMRRNSFPPNGNALVQDHQLLVRKSAKVKAEKEHSRGPADSEDDDHDDGSRQYWLMKAEPETRYEKGKDISFSIDDLAAKKESEPWDGIRNYVARNNLRAMKRGDLAFFSHSNCKHPGIVGTMEIVQEHSPDFSAQDPQNPYYDPKASPDDPRWSVVHVEFRTKFRAPILLSEMREFGRSGGALENMQMLKQSRLSVSRVSREEWNFLMRTAKEKAKAMD